MPCMHNNVTIMRVDTVRTIFIRTVIVHTGEFDTSVRHETADKGNIYSVSCRDCMMVWRRVYEKLPYWAQRVIDAADAIEAS